MTDKDNTAPVKESADVFSGCGAFAENSENDALKQQMEDFFAQEKGRELSKFPQNNKTVLKSLWENEDGDMHLFLTLFRDKYLYDHASGLWYYWNDHFWRHDKVGHVMYLFKDVIQLYVDQEDYELWSQAIATSEGRSKDASAHEKRAKALACRVRDLQTIRRKKAVIAQAVLGKDSLGDPGESWDSNHMLFGCRNGVIDLETGKHRKGRPGDMIKTVSPIKWVDKQTDCPTWKKFLLDIMGQDREMVSYLKRLLGYGITGLTTEHIYPILWGKKGRNGKSTLLETLKYVLGPMAHKAPATFLLQQSNNRGGGGEPDAVLMAFRGARIVWTSELNEGVRIDVAKLKENVGGDTISARPPYGKRMVEFDPTHLLFLLTNMLPKAPANDPAFWQRLHVIKFLYSFYSNPDPDDPYQLPKDKDLKFKLRAEAPAILKWLVEGCLEWQEFGLLPPEKIQAATDQYRADEDILGHFVLECCVTGDPKDQAYRVRPKALYDRYKEWCEDVGHHRMAKKHFLKDMRDRFSVKKNVVNYFVGVTILQVV